ncbi:7TM domain-containing protein [Wenyingzhuangia sp. IMCC45574]
MNTSKSFHTTIILLIAFSAISIGFKIKPIVTAYEDFAPTEVYEVNYNFYYKSKDQKVFIKSYLPKDTERQQIEKRIQTSKQMCFETIGEGNNLRGIWRAQKQNKFNHVHYSFVFKGKPIQYLIDDGLPKNLAYPKLHPSYLKAEEHIEVHHPKIDSLARVLTENTSDLKSIIHNLYKFVQDIPSAPIKTLTSALSAFEQNQASCNGKSRLFVALCRNSGIPARLKGGIILENTKKRTSHLWTEIYIVDKWVPFDVLNGHFAYLPAHYLEIYTGDYFLITHTPNILFDYQYKMKKIEQIPFVNVASNSELMSHPLSLLNISELNIIPKKALYFFLLLPLGGLLIALFKNVVGLKTYGVFLPVLIAYTLTATGFASGMFLFLVISGLVALVSVPLNKWGLLYTPKIVVILTFAVISILIIISLGVHFDIPWLTRISFFPIIIISIVSERFARGIEEDGYQKSFNTLFQTLIATSCCYLVFASATIKAALLIFPELILILVAIALLLGKWIGLRLFEYKRFYALMKEL